MQAKTAARNTLIFIELGRETTLSHFEHSWRYSFNMSSRRRAVVFPRQQRILEQLGENIELALKRRRISQELLHQRTGISKPTLRRITRGDSTVSIGHYMIVLAVLGLENDLGMVASDSVLIGKLESIAKLKSDSNA